MGIVVENSQLAMAKTLRLFNPVKKEKPFIDPNSSISKYASIGKNVSISWSGIY